MIRNIIREAERVVKDHGALVAIFPTRLEKIEGKGKEATMIVDGEVSLLDGYIISSCTWCFLELAP